MSEVDSEQLATRLLDLQKLLNEFLDIERLIFLPDGKQTDRRETDTEHSYHLAMLCWYLCGAFPNLDKSKVLRYALAHDVVEIHAGDVMAIGRTEDEQRAKEARETKALEKLKTDWPDFTDLTQTIEQYEAQADPESKFVKTFDKLTPMIHQIISSGKTWRKWDMDRRQVVSNKDEKTRRVPEVEAIWQTFRAEIISHPEWFNEGKAT